MNAVSESLTVVPYLLADWATWVAIFAAISTYAIFQQYSVREFYNRLPYASVNLSLYLAWISWILLLSTAYITENKIGPWPSLPESSCNALHPCVPTTDAPRPVQTVLDH